MYGIYGIALVFDPGWCMVKYSMFAFMVNFALYLLSPAVFGTSHFLVKRSRYRYLVEIHVACFKINNK